MQLSLKSRCWNYTGQKRDWIYLEAVTVLLDQVPLAGTLHVRDTNSPAWGELNQAKVTKLSNEAAPHQSEISSGQQDTGDWELGRKACRRAAGELLYSRRWNHSIAF